MSNKDKEDKILRMQELRDYRGDDRVVSAERYLELSGEDDYVKRVSSGFQGLDRLIDGFRPGELVVIAGPTGQGKTTLCRTLTEEIGAEANPSLWFSYEMPSDQLIKSFGDEVPAFYLPLKLRGNVMDWIKRRVEEGIAKYGVWSVFIDHLHFLLKMKELARVGSTSILLGAVLRELKKIALETETVIFLVSHLRKLRNDERPTIADLRDSSFTGQESDIVMLIWRMKEKASNERGYRFLDQSVLSVEKCRRTGKLGELRLRFEDGRFYEMVGDEYVE